MKTEKADCKILVYKVSLFCTVSFLESVMPSFLILSIPVGSNEIPAITSGPITEPRPASSIPPNSNAIYSC